MKSDDREQVLRYMAEGMEALEQAVAGLTAEQAGSAPPSGWSALAIVEHVALTERSLLGMITGGTPVPERAPSDPAKDAIMIARVIGRERRVIAPESLVPSGRFATIDEGLAAFRQAREATLEFVRTCERDLRNEHCVHPLLGLMPSYNCLLLAASHPARHAAQIREAMAAR